MSSNDLSQVRDYIRSRMAVVEPTYQEWTDSLDNIGNIPKTVLNRTYHITLNGTTASTNNDIFIQDVSNVVITIFKRGFTKPVEARDEVMQTANCIRLDIIDPQNVETYKAANDGNIEDIQSVGIVPNEIDVSNDNTIQVEIELNLRLYIGIT